MQRLAGAGQSHDLAPRRDKEGLHAAEDCGKKADHTYQGLHTGSVRGTARTFWGLWNQAFRQVLVGLDKEPIPRAPLILLARPSSCAEEAVKNLP